MSLFNSSPSHSPLPTKEVDESYSSDSDAFLLPSESTPKHQKRRQWPSIAYVFILVSSNLFAIIFTLFISNRLFNADSFCSRHTSSYSQLVNELDITYSTVNYNGSFFHQTVYRGDASPEVDEAWEALGVDYRAMAIPADEAIKSGIAKDQVHIKEKYGGAYPANVEGLHHLHCLNLLRQSLPWNIDYYKEKAEGPFSNPEHILKVHICKFPFVCLMFPNLTLIAHCVDILRQQLMCTVDTGLLGQVWWNPEKPAAFVDFNTQHKCKNYEAIRKWAEERQLPPASMTPPDFLQTPQAGDTVYAEIP
jgi:hypothetical protein